MNVAYVPEALKLSTVLHLLQYSNNTVKLDITGHKLSDEDLDTIERIDSTHAPSQPFFLMKPAWQ